MFMPFEVWDMKKTSTRSSPQRLNGKANTYGYCGSEIPGHRWKCPKFPQGALC